MCEVYIQGLILYENSFRHLFGILEHILELKSDFTVFVLKVKDNILVLLLSKHIHSKFKIHQ